MRSFPCLSVALAVSLGLGGVGWNNSKTANAVELNGQVYFERPPLLNNATTTRNTASVSNPTYYFTLTVPENAGESLGQVSIAQNAGDSFMRSVEYDTEETRAFWGTPRDRGEALTLADTSFDPETHTVTVAFDPPVPPGSIVTIGLEADRNPRQGGVYLFGVTAYPNGESPYGQFLGYGRLQIYERSDNFFFD